MAGNKVDITVIQKPVSIDFECPLCGEETQMDFDDFRTEAGDPCDWEYSQIECPHCNKIIVIGDVEWD